jgi:hypothetical protein
MAGLKRKQAADPPKSANGTTKPKKLKPSAGLPAPKSKAKSGAAAGLPAKNQKKGLPKKQSASSSEELAESDISEDGIGYNGSAAEDDDDEFSGFGSDGDEDAMEVDGEEEATANGELHIRDLRTSPCPMAKPTNLRQELRRENRTRSRKPWPENARPRSPTRATLRRRSESGIVYD